ncbi:MAG TPA: hypothetical protein PLM79_11580 [Syntrophobacteraceae bacterium]|nr:hypothetical protein [Syntrophobacteraceae bacterium]
MSKCIGSLNISLMCDEHDTAGEFFTLSASKYIQKFIGTSLPPDMRALISSGQPSRWRIGDMDVIIDFICAQSARSKQSSREMKLVITNGDKALG